MTPFKETDVTNKFWSPEDWDIHLPSPGFVTDFVLATRGFNTPTKFCAWTALFLISSVLKRDTEMDWGGMLKLYPNLFIFFVAPPALCAKSSVVNWGADEILRGYHEYILDPILKEKKTLYNIIAGSASPEGLFKSLAPRRSKTIQGLNGEFETVTHGSNATVIISELSNFLGKSQYKQELVPSLIKFYDCQDHDDNTTAGQRKKKLRDIYVTLLGATTQDGFDHSIPNQVTGGGFLSRVIINMMDGPTRFYAHPQVVEAGPTSDDLKKRLAWIAINSIGMYSFSKEAEKKYISWHKKYIKQYVNGFGIPGRERDNIHVVKLALLIRVQRYEEGKVISVQDVQEAIKLIDDVRRDAVETIRGIGLDEREQTNETIRRFIRRRGDITRRELLRALSSRRITANDITYALVDLCANGDVEIMRGGKTAPRASSDGDEVYYWMGGREE